MKNKFYFDIGAWTGDSVIEFIKRRNQNKEYEIYAFEPHPDLRNNLDKIAAKENFNFINECAWIDYDCIKFYPGVNNLTQSSTMFEDKKKFIDKDKFIYVKSLDFSRFFLNKTRSDSYCVIKMNCEGSEYSILEKMIDDGSINRVRELYVAWHNNKIKNITKERHDNLIQRLNKIDGLILKTWKFEEGQKESPFIKED